MRHNAQRTARETAVNASCLLRPRSFAKASKTLGIYGRQNDGEEQVNLAVGGEEGGNGIWEGRIKT